jgi:hypothetical protein
MHSQHPFNIEGAAAAAILEVIALYLVGTSPNSHAGIGRTDSECHIQVTPAPRNV